MYQQLMQAHTRRANLRLAACTIAALLTGIALGAGAASAVTVAGPAKVLQGATQWSAEHAAIPREAVPAELAPTF